MCIRGCGIEGKYLPAYPFSFAPYWSSRVKLSYKGGTTMKLISWNIDSINAALTGKSRRANQTREVLSRIAMEDADIIGFQETKLPSTGPTEVHLEHLRGLFPDYEITWRSSQSPARKSYAGTMYLYKKRLHPIVTKPVIGAPDTLDNEGRIITLEFPDIFITEVYTPNAGTELKRLKQRQIWDEKYREYLLFLNNHKPVIASGDFNVARDPIDLAHPEDNFQTAGYTDEERKGFSQILQAGFTDSFRFLYPDKRDVYSWWDQRIYSSKRENDGWRIDYWLVSDQLEDKIIDSTILDSGTRRDHAPIMLEISKKI